jgi:leucyl aminopeptidase
MDIPTLEVRTAGSPLSSVDADWLFLPVSRAETSLAVEDADAATGGELTRAIASGEFKAKSYHVFVTPVTRADWRARRVALVGAGDAAQFGPDLLRRLAAVAGLAARDRQATGVAFVSRQPFAASSARLPRSAQVALAQAIAEGLMFTTFDAGSYKTEDHDVWAPQRFAVCLPDIDAEGMREASEAVRQGVVLSEGMNIARALANEPGNRLRPRDFADRAAAIASHDGLRVEVLDEQQIAAMEMGLLLGVARGSEEPPRLLVIRHEPDDAPTHPLLGLVGKGVTFDTGGISIKPPQGMDRMKDDMAGGAAVVGALWAMARLKAPGRVIGVVPIAENMPSGHAIRPGDVLRGASGKTVEVVDTDAEGRLILADALWYARQQGATHLVDIATLTGACMIALGHDVSGLFARPQSWADTVLAAAQAAGDCVWPMPLVDDYLEMLRSDIADLKNVGGRPAGAITAAMFLAEFAGPGPWAHLDIAGTAWNEEAKEYLPKGPTGAGVKTLARLALAAGARSVSE